MAIPDADESIVRTCFEQAVKNQNFPLTRKGYSYRSTYTDIAWRLAFETVNLLKKELEDKK